MLDLRRCIAAGIANREIPKSSGRTTWNGSQCVGTPVGQAVPLSAADAAVLANVQIVKATNRAWKCTGAGGKPCSDTEVKIMTSATRR